MPRPSSLVATGVVVLILLAAVLADVADAKKRRPMEKKRVPNEVTELIADVGGSSCRKLAKHVKREGFLSGRRCDLFEEQLEELASMTDAMVNEMDMTQQDFVDTAMKPGNMMQLGMHMKTLAKFVLQRKTPSEKEIQEQLSKTMGQWILNVGTKSGGNGMNNLNRDAIKNLRGMGVNVPTYGAQDDDEMDEENALIPADLQWALENSDGSAGSGAATKDASDDEDGEL